jgi:hypothetical protein
MSENVGALTSRNPKGLHGLYRDNFTLPYAGLAEILVYVKISVWAGANPNAYITNGLSILIRQYEI